VPEPDESREDDPDSFCPGSDFPESEGCFHTLESHLSKLDGLIPKGNVDKFFQVHTDRWRVSMPRPGDELHSAKAAGADSNVRESRNGRPVCFPGALARPMPFAHPRTFQMFAVTKYWKALRM
jgi:hypothetical protein